MNDQLILVNESDSQIGTADKIEVHARGLLHRAISVFIFNDKGELLLQQRSKEKYHSAELWTNTCCSHPIHNESTSNAARRRLLEEMKIVTPLLYFTSFHYKAFFENGLIENEIDHVYFGKTNQTPTPDPSEVKNWKYINPQLLIEDVKKNSELYTAWLKICIDRKIFSELLSQL